MKKLSIILLVFVAVIGMTTLEVNALGKNAWTVNPAKEEFHPPLASGSSDSTATPIIDWPTFYGVQQTGEIDASFNCFGQFGAGFFPGFCPYGPCYPSFVTPPGSGIEYLFAGAIWVGAVVGQDTLVSVGADGWQLGREMFPPEFPSRGSVTKFDYPTDFSMRAEFTDTFTVGVDPDYFIRPHIPLYIRIANRSHVWHTDPYNWTVIYDMVITNMEDVPIEQGYVGFYFDGDVCFDCEGTIGFADDVTGTITTSDSEMIAYIIDNDGDLSLMPPDQQTPRAFAFKFLETSFPPAHNSFNWWISNGYSPYDFGPRERPYTGVWKEPFRDFGTEGIGTPEGDVNKYYIMRNQEWDYDQVYTAVIQPNDTLWLYPEHPGVVDFADGYDTRFLMSIGPFNLLPDSSMRILFATFTGDSVHTDPNNVYNLPYNPDQYLTNLNLADVLENAAWSDSLSHILLDPELPVTGLQAKYNDDDSAVVRWDPWVFDDVEGYEVYLWEVPPDSLPYPGVMPPWLEPDQLNSIASLGRRHQYAFDALDPSTFYLVNVAHRTTTKSVGDPGEPLAIKLGDRSTSPGVEKEYAYLQEGGPVVLTWTAPEKVTIDHYNIYRFANADLAAAKYHAFYDEGYHAQFITPKDTFLVDGQYYYYYAMDTHAQVDGGATSFTDFGVDEGMIYIITAIDEYGFESEFSTGITALVVETRTKDILVITNSGHPEGFLVYDSVTAFYDSVLSGYSYDMYNYQDSISLLYCPSGDCVDWHEFMRYRLLIVDDGIVERKATYDEYEDDTKGFTKYLLSGGKLAYFGSLSGLQSYPSVPDGRYYPASHSFIQRFFGIDSVFFVDWSYFLANGLPLVDTFFAFNRTEAVGSMPDVSYDTTRYPFAHLLQSFWPTNTPPSVSTFILNDSGETTHIFKALSGVNSMNEDEPIGVRTSAEGTETYLFGFHLWYMTYDEGRSLIESIFFPPPKLIIVPDTMFAFYSHAIDPMLGTIYLGDFSGERTPSDIVPSTMRINETVALTSWTILSSYPGFTNEVMEIVFPIGDFLETYGAFYGTFLKSFTVSGEFDDDASFTAYGTVTLIGHTVGDLNLDGLVNVADLTYLIAYQFVGGPPPLIEETADVNGDCLVNVADVSYLVNYLYRGGPAPVYCTQ